jgi:hypothetical protein
VDEAVDGSDEKNTHSLQNNFKGKRGPKTRAGKARVGRNAIQHGIFAQTPVLPLVERQEDWDELRQDVINWFDLEGPFMESLGERAAFLIWRLRRVGRFETLSIRDYMDDVPEDWQASLQLEGRDKPDSLSPADIREMDRMISSRLMPDDSAMDKITRYEARLHRYLLQTLYQISVLKGLADKGIERMYGIPVIDAPGMGRKYKRLRPPS